MKTYELTSAVNAVIVLLVLSALPVLAQESISLDCGEVPGTVTCTFIFAEHNRDVVLNVTGNGKYNGMAGQYGRDITSVNFSDGVEGIGNFVLTTVATLPNLMSVSVSRDNAYYCSIDGVLFNKDQDTLILYPTGKQGEYTIPNSVTTIGDNAFRQRSGLTAVTIPDGVVSIGTDAFRQCTSLTSVIIPSSVTSIGTGAFQLSTNLTSITILNPEPPTFGTSVFNSIGREAYFYVPEESVSAYKMMLQNIVFDIDRIKSEGDEEVSIRHSTTRNLSANQSQITFRGRNLNVRIPQSSVASSHSVRVLDLRGRQIANFRMGETNARTFSLARIPAGKYFVEVRNANTRIGSSSVIVR